MAAETGEPLAVTDRATPLFPSLVGVFVEPVRGVARGFVMLVARAAEGAAIRRRNLVVGHQAIGPLRKKWPAPPNGPIRGAVAGGACSPAGPGPAPIAG